MLCWAPSLEAEEKLWPWLRNCAQLFPCGPSMVHHKGVQGRAAGAALLPTALLLGCVPVAFGGI